MYRFKIYPGIDISDISVKLKEERETDVISLQEILQITYQMENMYWCFPLQIIKLEPKQYCRDRAV